MNHSTIINPFKVYDPFLNSERFTLKEIQVFERIFKTIDLQSKGYISKEDYTKYSQASVVQQSIDGQFTLPSFESFLIFKNNTITFYQFLSVLSLIGIKLTFASQQKQQLDAKQSTSNLISPSSPSQPLRSNIINSIVTPASISSTKEKEEEREREQEKETIKHGTPNLLIPTRPTSPNPPSPVVSSTPSPNIDNHNIDNNSNNNNHLITNKTPTTTDTSLTKVTTTATRISNSSPTTPSPLPTNEVLPVTTSTPTIIIDANLDQQKNSQPQQDQITKKQEEQPKELRNEKVMEIKEVKLQINETPTSTTATTTTTLSTIVESSPSNSNSNTPTLEEQSSSKEKPLDIFGSPERNTNSPLFISSQSISQSLSVSGGGEVSVNTEVQRTTIRIQSPIIIRPTSVQAPRISKLGNHRDTQKK